MHRDIEPKHLAQQGGANGQLSIFDFSSAVPLPPSEPPQGTGPVGIAEAASSWYTGEVIESLCGIGVFLPPHRQNS